MISNAYLYYQAFPKNLDVAYLIIETKDGDPEWANIAPLRAGIANVYQQGYSVTHTFYSPKYDKAETSNNTDLRTTVFWAPHVAPDQKGALSIQYFNAQEPGRYRVLMEGLDFNGRLSRDIFYYEVK